MALLCLQFLAREDRQRALEAKQAEARKVEQAKQAEAQAAREARARAEADAIKEKARKALEARKQQVKSPSIFTIFRFHGIGAAFNSSLYVVAAGCAFDSHASLLLSPNAHLLNGCQASAFWLDPAAALTGSSS